MQFSSTIFSNIRILIKVKLIINKLNASETSFHFLCHFQLTMIAEDVHRNLIFNELKSAQSVALIISKLPEFCPHEIDYLSIHIAPHFIHLHLLSGWLIVFCSNSSSPHRRRISLLTTFWSMPNFWPNSRPFWGTKMKVLT